MTEMVLPTHTNALGSVFGGTVMSWIDIAGATAATRHSRCSVVTASVDALHFRAPIRIGWIVTILASVNYVHKTSCEVGVKVLSENPLTGETFHTASAYLTFVSLGKEGKPVPMPALVLQTDEDKRRYEEAELRRQNRLKLKADLIARQAKMELKK
jgi:acyl-CoA hydrolase